MSRDAELASVMRKFLTSHSIYTVLDTRGGLTVDVSRVELTEDEQQAVEEVLQS